MDFGSSVEGIPIRISGADASLGTSDVISSFSSWGSPYVFLSLAMASSALFLRFLQMICYTLHRIALLRTSRLPISSLQIFQL